MSKNNKEIKLFNKIESASESVARTCSAASESMQPDIGIYQIIKNIYMK